MILHESSPSQWQQVKENCPPAVIPGVPVIPGLTRDPQNLANIKEIAGQSPQ